MKQLKRLFAWILAFALLVQASPLAYAEGGSGVSSEESAGVVYRYNTDGSVTAVYRAGAPTVCKTRMAAAHRAAPSAKHPAPHVKLGAARLGVPAETEDTDTGIPPAEIPAADDAVESTAASALLPEEENVQDSSVLTEDEAKEIGDSQELSDETVDDEAPADKGDSLTSESKTAEQEEASSDPVPESSVDTLKGSGDETDRSEAVASEPDSELKGSGEKTADPDDANNEGESSTAESDEETLQDGETEDLVESGEDSASLFPARIPAALSSVGDSAVIHSVVLYTYAAQVSGNSVFTACRISSAWSPNAVSYDSLSALSGRLIQTKSISAPGWIGWDLTAAAADWFSSAGNNSAYGVMIRGEGGVGSLDLSSAQAEYPAYYAITYTPFSFEKPKEAEEQETTEEPKKTEEDAKSLETEELNAAEIEAEDKYLKTAGQLLEEESSTAETVLARAKSIGAGLLGASELCTHSSVSFCYPVSATCTEGGYDFYVCTFCHNAVRLNETPPLGHSYDFAHPVSSNAATCTMASYANYECTRCGNPYSYKVSDALGHDYVYSYSTFSRTRHITHVTCSRCSDVDTTSLDVHVDANDDHVCDCCGFADYPDPAAVTLQVSAHGSGVNSCTGYLDLILNFNRK